MKEGRKYLYKLNCMAFIFFCLLLPLVISGCGQIPDSAEPHATMYEKQISSADSGNAASGQSSAALDNGSQNFGTASGQDSSMPDNSKEAGMVSSQNISTPGNDGENSGTAPGQTPSAPDGSNKNPGTASGQKTSSTGSNGSTEEIPVQGTIPSACGMLSVKGAQLVDSSGNPEQLKGISTHGIAWYPDYVNEACFRQLKEEWGVDVIRLAMYTAEYNGYCTGGDKDSLKKLIKDGVGYAAEYGLYVIIDWHILSDGNPNTYIEEATAFFTEMSKEYADYTNVIYEICNEPGGGTSWADIKLYAGQVIAAIRENDEDGIILVGTPNWCQYVDQAAADPIEGYENIMYTLHFYAATHTDALRDTMVKALEAGLPVFVSEYGICDASGNGAIDTGQANEWVKLLDQYRISYVAWNLSNKSETSALLKESCGKINGFTWEDLSNSGQWLYDTLQRQGEADMDGSNSGNDTAGNNDGIKDNPTGQTDSIAANNTGHNSDHTPADSEANRTPADSDTDRISADNNCDTGHTSADGNSRDSPSDGTGSLTIDARIVNSWQQGDDTYYQYSVTLTNNTEEELTTWRISLSFSGSITLTGSWNGTYQAEDCTLTVSSMDYNSQISQGGSVSDIGFILYGANDLTILDAVVY